MRCKECQRQLEFYFPSFGGGSLMEERAEIKKALKDGWRGNDVGGWSCDRCLAVGPHKCIPEDGGSRCRACNEKRDKALAAYAVALRNALELMPAGYVGADIDRGFYVSPVEMLIAKLEKIL